MKRIVAALAALGMTLAIGAATTGASPDSEAWAGNGTNGNIGGLLGGGRVVVGVDW